MDKNNNIYAGGQFTGAGMVSANNIAKFDGTNWSALGTGLNDVCVDILITQSGLIYACGDFTTAGSQNSKYISRWNGIAWDGLDNEFFPNGVIYFMQEKTNGILILSGNFDTIGGLEFSDGLVFYKNGSFYPNDIELPGSSTVNCFLFTDRFLYIGFNTAGTAISATVTSPTVDGNDILPIFKIVGPGKIWQIKNFTTGQALYFDGLTLLTGETVTIDLSTSNKTFISSFRGNIGNYVLDSSDIDFVLAPGTNNVSAYLTGDAASSKITMSWKPTYNTLDEALYD
jgi:hypothetical protein